MRRPGRNYGPESGPRGQGHHYDAKFVSAAEYDEIVAWLQTLEPLWEMRYPDRRARPEGKPPRRLLRPVYWLGNWQFACLDYYRPPKGIRDRCVKAEPFPPVLARMIGRVESMTRRVFGPSDLPARWHLNTCLVNLYGTRIEDGKREDTARVGEHKDFEPGPVASISLGERALLQFVSSRRPGQRDAPFLQQWLDHGSLQVFGGDLFKKRLFHRVQRVDRRAGCRFDMRVEGFETRRVNFTFRYVPDEHVTPFAALAPEAREDVRGYVETLAKSSAFWREQLSGRG